MDASKANEQPVTTPKNATREFTFSVIRNAFRWLPEGVRRKGGILHYLMLDPAVTLIEQAILGVTRKRVLQGPFRGLFLDLEMPFFPMLLGTYEIEVHAAVESLMETPFELIANVGAAEGFYTIGLARRMPKAQVVSFELEERQANKARQLARSNGVEDRVQVLGLCTHATLITAMKPGLRTLVFMDVEGAEEQLLDPEMVPELVNATIFLETHDLYRPGVTDLIRSRFEPTHDVVAVRTQPRIGADFPVRWIRSLCFTRPARQALLRTLDELRTAPMEWLIATPRAQPCPGKPLAATPFS